MKQQINEIKNIYRLIFRSAKNFSQVKLELQELTPKTEHAQHLIQFCLADSARGLTLKKDTSAETEE